MAWYNEFLQIFLDNPVLLALLIAAIRNIGGYLYNGLKFNAWQYDKKQFLATLTLWETFFIAFNGVAGLSASTTTILTALIDVIYSLKNSLAQVKAA